jgi:hypothetical protein
MSEIELLESILASAFWQDGSRRCVIGEITLEVTRERGSYRWRLNDRRNGSHVRANRPWNSLQAAKEDMRLAIEAGLARHRDTPRE